MRKYGAVNEEVISRDPKRLALTSQLFLYASDSVSKLVAYA
jgi:hypothetical protein